LADHIDVSNLAAICTDHWVQSLNVVTDR
jgi:hypothetical protein